MRTKGQIHHYVVPELAVKLHAADGAHVDALIGYNVGTTVTFDYEYATEDEPAQAFIQHVRSVGAALEGEKATLNLWLGCDIKSYLTDADIEEIAEAMVEHMAEVIKDENEASLIHSRT